MTTDTKPKQDGSLATARESFSGRLLTGAQFEEAIAITRIVEREIQKSGAFKDKLSDYAHAFARSEKFDAMKAETIVRDLFKERTGRSMNQLREALIEREKTLGDAERQRAYEKACAVGDMIETGRKISFARAYSAQAEDLAGALGITDVAAKSLMKDEFKAVEKTELYDWGKDLEERFYRPQIEAEAREREATQARAATRTSLRTRTGPSGP
ncbi:hypothetical protein [Methylobacterium marchantiae]|uniref:Uncharacterized protein n=1 Tax=Methylobacterium marchantiae TaxID=600331 RepID=A0ABW3WY72_9HYPH|nr:hypothetical protein AIGOOFII_3137 [Methylobacterium marchantiae]